MSEKSRPKIGYMGPPDGIDARYRDLVREHLAGRLPEPDGDGVRHVEVRHDDGCPRLEGGRCGCDPVVESGARINEKYGGGDGVG